LWVFEELELRGLTELRGLLEKFWEDSELETMRKSIDRIMAEANRISQMNYQLIS
jgi:hypothetical protein